MRRQSFFSTILTRALVALLFAMFTLGVSVGRANAETPKLKVGVILPLSGPVAAMGQAFRRGFSLFERESPDSSVEFVFEDHRYDGKAAVSALHKLRDFDKVDLAVVWGNTPGDSCAPVAEQERFPLIAASMNPVAKGREFVVSLGPPLDRLVGRVVDQFKEWKLGNPAAVSIDIGNALKGVDNMKEALSGNLVVRVVAAEETDFKSLIMSLRAKRIDGVFLLLLPDQALTFVKQASHVKFYPKIIGGDVFADEEFQKQGAAYSPDLSYVYGAVDPAFIARLKEEFGSTSYFFEAATGYTLALLSERVSKKRRSEPTIEPLKALAMVERNGVPLLGFQLLRTEEYGLHFENEGFVYRAQQ